MPQVYDPGQGRTIDNVRLLVGDTDNTDYQLDDREITFFLAQEGTIYRAAAAAAEAIAAKYARQSDYKLKGDLAENISQLQRHYTTLAIRLRQRAARSGIIPYAGGTSIADKQTREDDTDWVRPEFSRDMHAEPGTDNAEFPLP